MEEASIEVLLAVIEILLATIVEFTDIDTELAVITMLHEALGFEGSKQNNMKSTRVKLATCSARLSVHW
jgi:hypothetical protein